MERQSRSSERESRSMERRNETYNPYISGTSIDEIDPENNELYNRDYYLAEDFPRMNLIRNLNDDEFPEFIKNISTCTLVSEDGFCMFFLKFGLLYLQSEFVRAHTDNWVFLFYQKRYIGAFSTMGKADSYASRFTESYYTQRMYLLTIYEYNESISSVSRRYTEIHNIEGKEIHTYLHSYYNVDCSISVLNDNEEIPIKLCPNNNFIFDTGCTTSHTIFQDYINHDYIYSEYPLDEYNNKIENPHLLKSYLLEINKQILKHDSINVNNSTNFGISKMILIYKENTYFLLNDKIYVKLDSTTFPSMIKPEKPSAISRILSNVISLGSPPRNNEEIIPLRPKISNDILLGLNIINQIEIQTRYIRNDISTLTLKHPKIYESKINGMRRYDWLKTFYEIFTMEIGFRLFALFHQVVHFQDLINSENEALDELNQRLDLLDILENQPMIERIDLSQISLNNLTFYSNSDQISDSFDFGNLIELESYDELNLVNLIPYTNLDETNYEIEKLKRYHNIHGFIVNNFIINGSFVIKLNNFHPFIRSYSNLTLENINRQNNIKNIENDINLLMQNIKEISYIETGN